MAFKRGSLYALIIAAKSGAIRKTKGNICFKERLGRCHDRIALVEVQHLLLDCFPDKQKLSGISWYVFIKPYTSFKKGRSDGMIRALSDL